MAGRPKVFLSYARADAEPIAARLEKDLQAQGYEVWRDRTRLVPGVSWEDQCAAAIADSQVMLALISPSAVRGEREVSAGQSDSVCLYELSYARHHKIPVVPALVATCDLPLTIHRLHCEDLRRWAESDAFRASAVDRLASYLEAAARGELRLRQDALPQTFDFLPFLRGRRQGFTGRGWLFQRLDDLVAGPSRAVLITGDPGIGKSAIVAELVYTNPGGRILAYHCCQWNRRDTLDPGRFVAHLAGMLASRLDEYAGLLSEELRAEALPLDDAMTAFDRAIVGPLSRLTQPPDGARYLLIDALDESLAGVEDGSATIVALLAQYLPTLPDWLRVVATTRGDPDVLARLDGLRGIELRAADSLNRDDVASYIRGRLPDAAEQVITVADGNFLVARTVIDAVANGMLSLDKLDQLAPGLGSVYLAFFERMFPTKGSYEDAALLLGTVIGAYEPLDAATLAAITGLDANGVLRDLLDRLAAFLPASRGGHALFHKSLADWLVAVDKPTGSHIARRFRINPLIARARLTDWCWTEYERGPHDMAPYARRYLPMHLISEVGFSSDARMEEEAESLVRLLHDWHYVEARAAGGGGEFRDLLRDYLFAVTTMSFAPLPERARANRKRWIDELSLIKHALDLSAHAVSLDPAQLAGQFIGRLRGWVRVDIQGMLEDALRVRGTTWLCPLTGSLVPAGGRLRWTFRGRPAGHKGTVRSIAIGSSSALTAGNSHPDQTVRAWNLLTGALVWSQAGAAEAGGRTALAILPTEPSLAVASHRGRLRIWHLDTGATFDEFDAHDDLITALAFAADGLSLISGSADGVVHVWDVGNLPKHRTFSTGSPVERIAVNDKKGRIVTLSSNGAAVWSLDTLERVDDPELAERFAPLRGDWPGYGGAARPIAIDPDGAYTVCAQDGGALEVWDVNKREVIAHLRAQGSEVSAVEVSSRYGTVVSAQYDHDVKVWDLTTENPVPERPHRGHVESIVLLPEEKLAVVQHRQLPGEDAAFEAVWDWDRPSEIVESQSMAGILDRAQAARRARGLRLREVMDAIDARGGIPRHGDVPYPRLIDATPDGRLAVFSTAPRKKGSDIAKYWQLLVWDVAAHRLTSRLEGHHGLAFSASISADGSLIASASEDATVKLWRSDGTCVATFTGDSEMSSVAMSPDGRMIVAGERGGCVHLLQVVSP